jgi:hypothetical protein
VGDIPLPVRVTTCCVWRAQQLRRQEIEPGGEAEGESGEAGWSRFRTGPPCCATLGPGTATASDLASQIDGKRPVSRFARP